MVWPSPTEALLLLALIENGESYGLEIVKTTGTIKRGTVYVLLSRLETKGLVESRVMPNSDGYIGIPRRLYKATPLGKKCRQAIEALSRS